MEQPSTTHDRANHKTTGQSDRAGESDGWDLDGVDLDADSILTPINGNGDQPSWRASPSTAAESIAGRYLLEGSLERGLFETTYRGVDQDSGRPVLVKLFTEQASEHGPFREGLLRLAGELCGLEHPGLAAVLDAGVDGRRLYLVVEQPDGPSLRTLLAERGTLTVERTVTIGTQVAEVLAYVHRLGRVHGDVRPENIHVGEHGQAKLANLGLAELASVSGLLSPIAMPERAAYLSPEQVLGNRPNPRSDVYSLALVLYEALAGAPPFGRENTLVVASQRLVREPLPLRRGRPDLPLEVDNAILHALASSPAERYSSADQFRAALLERELALQAAPWPDLPPIAYAETSPRTRRSALEKIALLAPALATVSVAVVAFLFFTVAMPRMLIFFQVAEIPDLSGRSLDEAALFARAAGLEVTVESLQPSDDLRRNTVITHIPGPGAQASRSSPIKLVVSAGIRTPDVRGMNINEARVFLVRHGWTPGRIETRPAPEAPDTVVDQRPAAGELVADKRELVLIVAGGNYAEGAPVRASAGTSPDAAVDGNSGTHWTAGAPAPQWIDVDTTRPMTIAGLELVTWQQNSGPTIHEVWVTAQDGNFTPVHTFRGITEDSETLQVRFDRPIERAVRVRVHTALSAGEVGWREIRILE